MTKRNRGKRAVLAAVERESDHLRFADLPLEWFTSQETAIDEMQVRVRRRNPLGHIATVYGGVRMPTRELGNLDAWLRERAGGGNYFLEFSDPQTPNVILATCSLKIEGRVKPAESLAGPEPEPVVGLPPELALSMYAGFAPDEIDLGQDPDQESSVDLPFVEELYPETEALAEAPIDLSHASPPEETMSSPVVHPAPAPASKWSDGLPPSERAAFLPPAAAAPARPAPRGIPGVASMTSDLIEREARQRAEVELASLKAEIRSLVDRQAQQEAQAAARERALEKQLAEKEAEAREQRHQADMRALADKLEAVTRLAQAPAAAPAPAKTSPAEIAALLAPFVPVLTTLVSGRQAAEQAQIAMLAALATREAPAAPDPLASGEKLVAMMTPFITAAMAPREAPKSQDFDGMAKMFATLSEQTMQQQGMTANLLGILAESQAPEAAKPFLQQMIDNAPGISRLMKGLGEALQPMLAGALAQPQMGMEPARLPQPIVHRPVTQAATAHEPATQHAPSSRYSTVETPVVEVVGAPAHADAQVADAPQNAVVDGTAQPVAIDIAAVLPLMPAAFTTPTWRRWIKTFHAGELASEVGSELATLLSYLEADQLPDDVAEGLSTDPAGFIERMGSLTPMGAANPIYLHAVTHFAMVELRRLGDAAVAAGEVDEDEEIGSDDDSDDEEESGRQGDAPFAQATT